MGSYIKWLYLAFLPIILANDYCSVCSNHTMCRFTKKNPACGRNSEGGVSPAEAKKIVDLHNAHRKKISDSQKTQPPTENIPFLVWDEKLAEVAQRWADQCTFQHDQCRNDPRFEVGQNIYLSSGFPTVNWTRAVDSWYNEVHDFSSKNINTFEPDAKNERFTQIDWAKATHIGCGRTSFDAAYRPYENRPQEFVLSTIDPKNIPAKIRIARQENPGFFGGAKFDSSGAKGAITSSSRRAYENGESLKGYRPSKPIGGNFLNNGISRPPLDNLGFFGGAIFNPNGAQGAITASSSGISGSSGSVNGNQRPQHFGGNFLNNGFGGGPQNNLGFFGGAIFNPKGAQGAITASSSGISGSSGSVNGNWPPKHFGGNFGIQNNPGFFGGASFNPAGAQGAITASKEISGSSGSVNGNWPPKHFAGNFGTQNNPGFFGGASFNPAGAQGAITASAERAGNGPDHLSPANFPGYYPGIYDLNSASHLQFYGRNLMNIPAGSLEIDNEDSTREQSSNEWIPLRHNNPIGKDHLLICNYG